MKTIRVKREDWMMGYQLPPKGTPERKEFMTELACKVMLQIFKERP